MKGVDRSARGKACLATEEREKRVQPVEGLLAKKNERERVLDVRANGRRRKGGPRRMERARRRREGGKHIHRNHEL